MTEQLAATLVVLAVLVVLVVAVAAMVVPSVVRILDGIPT